MIIIVVIEFPQRVMTHAKPIKTPPKPPKGLTQRISSKRIFSLSGVRIKYCKKSLIGGALNHVSEIVE